MKTLSAETKEWLQWVRLTSHPLKRITEGSFKGGIGSAALVDYRGRRFALMARHVVQPDQDGWVLDIGTLSREGLAVHHLGICHYILQVRPSTPDVAIIDFSFAEVPKGLNTFFQERTPRFQGEVVARHVFETELSDGPTLDNVYAFSGEIKPEQLGDSESFLFQPVVYPGLKYLRSEHEFDIFKLPVSHPGHAEFRGCSGAPIVGMDRRPVALLVDGIEDNNTVRGVSLRHCRPALDIYCDHQDVPDLQAAAAKG